MLTNLNTYAIIFPSQRSRREFDNLREKVALSRFLRTNSRKAITAIVLCLMATTLVSSSPASAGGTGGEGGYPPSQNCASGSPSGVSSLSYNESYYPGYAPSIFQGVTTADENNCATFISVEDIIRTTSGHVVIWKGVEGVKLNSIFIDVTDPHDSGQYASFSRRFSKPVSSFSLNTDDLPAFVYHAPTKKGQKPTTSYVRAIRGLYISGTDANYPAAPPYSGCPTGGCG